MSSVCSRWLFHAYHSLIRIPQPSLLTWLSSSISGNARKNSSGAARPDPLYRFRGCPVATNSRAPDVTAVLSGLNSSVPCAVEAQPRLPGLCNRSSMRQTVRPQRMSPVAVPWAMHRVQAVLSSVVQQLHKKK